MLAEADKSAAQPVIYPVNPRYAEIGGREKIDTFISLMREVGQAPIRLKREINGFVVNRLLIPYMLDAIRALEKEFHRPTTILFDLQGPKLRVGNFAGGGATFVGLSASTGSSSGCWSASM